ncbi:MULTISPECIES: hypothetical protein [Actinomyces]|uniref:Toxin HicA n=1 Tax=Actinomyces respiraculi TaxID=2744574 RepID=A0A7T0PVB7_9ACTO|nr:MULTISPECIES: hypothetical protein [Actinomyces]QPL05151.1 hypothetical protein ID810_10530 [Actinomyces respiraculi]
MKRRDLEKALQAIAKEHGLTLTLKEGGNYTIATVGTWREPIPRHREVAEMLARKIIKRCQDAQEEN